MMMYLAKKCDLVQRRRINHVDVLVTEVTQGGDIDCTVVMYL